MGTVITSYYYYYYYYYHVFITDGSVVLDSFIDKENNCVTIDADRATATVITQDDEGLMDTITKTTTVVTMT